MQDAQEKTWIVDFCGTPGDGSYEYSVIHRDNTEGRRSYGWGCENKIIMFKSGVGGNRLSAKNDEWARQTVQGLCDFLNEKFSHV